MKSNVILSPSILSADFANLEADIKMIEDQGGSMVHVDVMDGHFVPQISYGQPVIQSIRKTTSLPFDVHLMIEHPEDSLKTFIDCGADYITFHAEATNHADRCIQIIHEAGKKAGIALNPATPVSIIEPVLPYVDLVLVMTVNPGFGGQKLIPYTLNKVTELAEKKEEKNFKYLVSVDGGVNEDTLDDVIKAGTDIFVSGSAFFRGKIKWEK